LRLGHDRGIGEERRVGERGRASLTRFERLARIARRARACRSFACRLATGRTHQIRVHLAARGWPLVATRPTASRAGRRFSTPRSQRRSGYFSPGAHAWRVAFTHPVTHDRLRLEAPVPPDLGGLLDAVGLEALFRRPRARRVRRIPMRLAILLIGLIIATACASATAPGELPAGAIRVKRRRSLLHD